MKTPMFSIYDTVANMYGFPFPAVNQGTAVRQFQAEQAISGGQQPMQTHPADFRLFEVGSFDSTTGVMEILPQPVFLVQGVRTSPSPAEG